jgi:hypothetical protein
VVGAENRQELARYVDGTQWTKSLRTTVPLLLDVATPTAESLADVLKSTASKEVTGSWRSGRHQGNWWLKGSRQPLRR